MGYLEVYERKTTQTLIVTAALGFGLLMAYVFFFVFEKLNLPELRLTGTVLTLLPIIWVLTVYRIPRGLRLYPEQQAVRRYFTVYGVRFFNRWSKLSERALVVKPCAVYAMEAPDGKTKTAIALTGVLYATGIIGTLLSLGMSNELQEVRTTAYMIVIEPGDKHLAMLKSREHAQQMVDMYDAAMKNELDGYRSAPRRFEKPPGA